MDPLVASLDHHDGCAADLDSIGKGLLGETAPLPGSADSVAKGAVEPLLVANHLFPNRTSPRWSRVRDSDMLDLPTFAMRGLIRHWAIHWVDSPGRGESIPRTLGGA